VPWAAPVLFTRAPRSSSNVNAAPFIGQKVVFEEAQPAKKATWYVCTRSHSLTQSHTQRHIDKQGRRRNTDRVASFDVRRFLFFILLPLKFLFLARMAAKMVFTAGLDLSVELHSNYPSFFLWIAVAVSAHVANTHVYTYIYTC
jgi:hypothetical protein